MKNLFEPPKSLSPSITRVFTWIVVVSLLPVSVHGQVESAMDAFVFNVDSETSFANSGNDCAPAIRAALEQAATLNKPTTIRFGEGRYHLGSIPHRDPKSGQPSVSLNIKNFDNLTIEGVGIDTELIFTDPQTMGIMNTDSHNITIRNFSIDYDPLPYARGSITEVNFEENSFTLLVDHDYLELDHPAFQQAKAKWGLVIRVPKAGPVQYGPNATFAHAMEKVGERLWKITTNPSSRFEGDAMRRVGLRVGDRYIHMARNYAPAISAIRCDNVTWEGITIYAAPGLSFYPNQCNRLTIRNCHVKPLKNKGRLFSTNGDGIHLRGSRGRVLVEGCSFEGMADDSVNVHSSALSITKVHSPTKVEVKKHTYSVRVGDKLEAVSAEECAILGQAHVTDIEEKLHHYILDLDSPIEGLKTGEGFHASDNLYNLSEAAMPFIIRNNHFKSHRARALLVSGIDGIVEGNTFENREGWCIEFLYESHRWAEGPLARDVVIRDNIFIGQGGNQVPIRLHPLNRKDQPSQSKVFKNIAIEDNVFRDTYGTVLKAFSVDGLTFTDNKMFVHNTLLSRPEHNAIELYNCENVLIDRFGGEVAHTKLKAPVFQDERTQEGDGVVIRNVQISTPK